MKTKRTTITAFALGLITAFLMSLMVVPGFAATVAKTITVYTGITLYYDGVKVEPKDATGKKVEPLLYNGTTYLPVRAISNLFGEDINWDGKTQSVYIGDMPGKKTYLGIDLEPYSSSDYRSMPTLIMDGKNYMNGFELRGFNYGSYAIFNLNGQYNTLEVDIGHTDWIDENKQILFYLDGSLAQTVEIGAEEMVKHVRVPLKGAMQLKIFASDSNGYEDYGIGFANAELS